FTMLNQNDFHYFYSQIIRNMKKIVLLAGFLLFNLGFGQKINEYEFTYVVNNDHTKVENQGKTGTCWSFSTVSFLESEVKRITGKEVDLSEMFMVKKTYPEKAYNYVYRQGKAQFSEGGMAHDVMNAVRKYGVVPQANFTGFVSNEEKYDHSIMVQKLTAYVENLVNYQSAFLKEGWMNDINQILDDHMGKDPQTFTYEGKTFTP